MTDTVVVLSNQRWDEALRTNRQRIAIELSRADCTVLYVDTGQWAGRRLAARIRGRVRPMMGEPGLTVKELSVPIPFGWRSRRICKLNAWVAARQLRAVRRPSAGQIAFLIYDPRAIAIADRFAGSVVCYDCVDNHAATVTGRARRVVEYFDDYAARRADVVTATSAGLLPRLRARNPNTFLVENVADIEHFGLGHMMPPPRGLPRTPILGFAGNLHDRKIDLDLVRGVATLRPDWHIVLIGPASSMPSAALHQAAALPNVHMIGEVEYAELPAWVARFTVGIIPYKLNEYTKTCFPLKLYEYLACGLPVVFTGLPNVPTHPRHVLHVNSGDPAAFVEGVRSLLENGTHQDSAERQGLAAGHTWRARAARLRALITEAEVNRP